MTALEGPTPISRHQKSVEAKFGVKEHQAESSHSHFQGKANGGLKFVKQNALQVFFSGAPYCRTTGITDAALIACNNGGESCYVGG